MSVVIVVGAQWGDEGKGKVVDLMTERADGWTTIAALSDADDPAALGCTHRLVKGEPIPV